MVEVRAADAGRDPYIQSTCPQSFGEVRDAHVEREPIPIMHRSCTDHAPILHPHAAILYLASLPPVSARAHAP